MQRVTFSTRALAQKIAATTASTSSREEAVIASHTPVLLDEVRFTISSLSGWRLMARVESRYLRLWSCGTTHRRGVAMAPTWTAQRVLVTMLEGCYRPIPVPRCCALMSTPRYTTHAPEQCCLALPLRLTRLPPARPTPRLIRCWLPADCTWPSLETEWLLHRDPTKT